MVPNVEANINSVEENAEMTEIEAIEESEEESEEESDPDDDQNPRKVGRFGRPSRKVLTTPGIPNYKVYNIIIFSLKVDFHFSK